MAKSKITSKNQTTVPKEVRDELGVGPQDVLHWELRDGYFSVTPASRTFLRRRGAVKVGPGSVVEDVRRARERRGAEE